VRLSLFQHVKSLWQQLTHPSSAVSDDEYRQYLTKAILVMMAASMTVVTLIILSGLLAGAFAFQDFGTMLGVYLPIMGGTWLVMRGHWRIARFLPILVMGALASYLTYSTGFGTTGQLYYVITFLLAGMLLGEKKQWLVLILAISSYLIFGVMRNTKSFSDALSVIITVSAGLVGVSLLQWLSTKQLSHLLERTRLYAAELVKRSFELAETNQELLQEVTERTHAEAALQRYADRLTTLRQGEQAVLTLQSPEAVGQTVMKKIRELVPCMRASITIFDDNANKVTFLALYSESETPHRMQTSFRMQDFGGILKLQPGSIRLVNDLAVQPARSLVEEGLLSEGVRSILSVPLLSAGNLIGSLNLGAAEPLAFNQEHIEISMELAGSLSLALQNARLFNETQQQAQILTSLYEISLTTSSLLDRDELLMSLYERVRQILPLDTFMVANYIAETAELEIIFAIEEGQVLQQWIGERLSLEDGGLSGWVLREGQPLLVNDMQNDTLPAGPIHGVRPAGSWLGVPMITRGQKIGALSVQSFQSDAFNEAHLRFMESLAGQIAISLDNAQLFGETNRRAEEFQTLSEISAALRNILSLAKMLPMVLEKTTQALGVERGTLFLIQSETGDLVARACYPPALELPDERHPLGEGVIGKVAATGEIAITGGKVAETGDDVDWGAGAGKPTPPTSAVSPDRREYILSLPLRTNQRQLSSALGGSSLPTIGVMQLKSLNARLINPENQHLASMIADMAAGAIWRAILFEETQRRYEHLLALQKIDRAINSSPELSLVLNVLLDQGLSQLQVDAATVLLLNPHTLTLDFTAQRGFHTRALQETHLSLGEGFAGRAALERRIIQVDHLTQSYGSLNRAKMLINEGFQAYFAVPLIAKGQVKGVLEIFHREELSPNQEWREFLDALATQAALAIDNARMFEGLLKANVELVYAYDATIEGWSNALDLRDKETEGHSQRVAELTLSLARELGVSDQELVHVSRGALLHDIGKMGIPDHILLKPGPLTDEEWEIMRQHPVYAYQLLYPITYLRPALDIPYCHHERWDGSGYPRGLLGEQIPLTARIFAVVDVWDALNSERPYRKAWPKGKTFDYIRSQSGIQFDPRVVEVFLDFQQRAALDEMPALSENERVFSFHA
jgi:putative nucleotidyltransferase with HDIG domain